MIIDVKNTNDRESIKNILLLSWTFIKKISN
jgi:hypothetical protein